MSIRTAFSWARPRAWRIVSLVSVLLVGMLLAAPAAHAAGITYYVSAAGDDANSGTSTSAPWRSLSKINNTVFGPGDQILLRSGDVWSGGITMRSAGSDGNPITIGAYGSGNKPLINGGGTVQGAVQIIDVSNIVVDGLALTNYTGASVYDDPECNCDGIKILGFGAATDNLTIRNNEVYNVEGFSNNASIGPPRGTTLDPSQNNLYTSGAIYQGGTAHNVTIENNYIHDNSNDGMQLTTVSSGLVIRNNMVNNTGADGITYENTTSPLIEHNSVIGAGNNSGTATLGPGEIGGNGAAVAGLWGAFHTGQVAQFNYVEGTKRILWDGQAWDFDNGTSNGVYQYNFSRDNDGGFALGGNDSEVYRYNISYNDGVNQTPLQGFFNAGSAYYNNVFYQTNGKGFISPTLTGATFTNNIFHTNATENTTYGSNGATYTNNCFSGSQNAQNVGSAAVVGDAKFVDPSSVGTNIDAVGGLKLQPDSPCINAGAVVAGNGGRDYWGDPLYNGPPDIGAYEYTPPALGDAHSGLWALQQAATGTPSMTGSFQTVDAATNSNYHFSAWVKGQGQQGKLVVYNSSWQVITESTPYTSSGTWTQVSTPTFNTGDNSTLIVQFIDLATTAGTTYLDDTFLGASGGVNKLTNPSFESGDSGWNMGAPFTTQKVISARSGSWALQQLDNGTPSMTGSWQQASVDPNSDYTFSAWVRGAGQQGKLVVYNSSWQVITESTPYTSSGTWTQVSTPTFNTGDNSTLIVQFIDLATTAGTTYLDDTFLGASGGANKLTNNDFESGNTGWNMGAPFTIEQL